MSLYVPNSTTTFLSRAFTLPGTTDLTIMCWAYLAGSLVAYRNFFAAEPNIAMQTFSDGVTFDAGTQASDNLGRVLVLNNWYHLTETVRNASISSRNIRGYINGVLSVNATNTETFVAYTTLTVGNSQQFLLPLQGNIRDLRVWTRCLSPQDIYRETMSAKPISRDGLIIWSPFDVDQVTDKSGTGPVWTVNGAGLLTQGGPRNAYQGRGMQFVR